MKWYVKAYWTWNAEIDSSVYILHIVRAIKLNSAFHEQIEYSKAILVIEKNQKYMQLRVFVFQHVRGRIVAQSR